MFAPGKHTLEPSHQAYLDNLAKLLSELPGVHLVLCGRVRLTDHQVLFPAKNAQQQVQPSTDKDVVPPTLKLTQQKQQALLNLAMQCAESINDCLIQAGNGRRTDRLIVYEPEVELQAEGISGVEISL